MAVEKNVRTANWGKMKIARARKGNSMMGLKGKTEKTKVARGEKGVCREWEW